MKPRVHWVDQLVALLFCSFVAAVLALGAMVVIVGLVLALKVLVNLLFGGVL